VTVGQWKSYGVETETRSDKRKIFRCNKTSINAHLAPVILSFGVE
jgi:hypothetical protein